ncbi:MAG: hypothetical protein JO368_06280 [Acidimicrobiales bacterium]|nr:hypothetical protein [Acidimicrobiales bacterium]
MPSRAKNSTGRWVERAATTGGGRTYRGQVPINWYASLILICVVGLLLLGFSRYERTHPTVNTAGQPTTSQVWHAALATDICGTMKPSLPASTNAGRVGLTTDGSGVVTIAPKNSSESGGNATLGRFVTEYGNGLQLSDSTLRYPGESANTNGDVCPKGTPDSGKQGVVIVYSWPNFSAQKGSETSGAPQDLRFTNGQLITMAFVPATASIPKPPGKVVTSLITAVEQSAGNAGGTTTSTTVPVTTTPSVAPTASTSRTGPTVAPSTTPTT